MIRSFPCEALTWEDMYEYSRVLAGKMREDKFRPDVIVAMSRGGYVPARSLCDFLMVYDLRSINIDHLGEKPAKALAGKTKGKSVLVVDDLMDESESMEMASAYLKTLGAKVRTASVFVLETAKKAPDYYAARKPWKWFVFPWNFNEDLTRMVAGLYDSRNPEKKSLDMIAEELKAKHGLKLDEEKLRKVMENLVQHGILKPYWVSGNLMRWAPYLKRKKVKGGLGGRPH
ncbi:phosphoribosyltransferase [Candidatus Micrarchaeota archaeon]|nr:phosphoribosyltransferase [Candidatus Micrarchaeota archaeon]